MESDPPKPPPINAVRAAPVEVMATAAPAPGNPGGNPMGISKLRLRLAFAVAIASDIASVGFTLIPPIQWTVDLVTAGLLFVLLGWRWVILPGLIMEAIPGVSLFPAWVLVVGAVAVWGTARPRLN